MIVGWTAGALSDLREIREYIARDSPQAAQRVVEHVFASSVRLARVPRSAKEILRSPGHSIRALADPPYQILYEIREKSVLVVAVVHGRRDLRELLSLIKEHP